MIVLAVSGMTIFLVPPTTSSPGQGHGPGNGGNGGGTSGGQSGATSNNLASLSTSLFPVDQISDSKGLGYGGQRKIVVDSIGSIYVAYRKAPPGFSQDEIYVAVSTDNGKTWADLGGGPGRLVRGSAG